MKHKKDILIAKGLEGCSRIINSENLAGRKLREWMSSVDPNSVFLRRYADATLVPDARWWRVPGEMHTVTSSGSPERGWAVVGITTDEAYSLLDSKQRLALASMIGAVGLVGVAEIAPPVRINPTIAQIGFLRLGPYADTYSAMLETQPGDITVIGSVDQQGNFSPFRTLHFGQATEVDEAHYLHI